MHSSVIINAIVLLLEFRIAKLLQADSKTKQKRDCFGRRGMGQQKGGHAGNSDLDRLQDQIA
jgi:hypothetical protein